MKAPILFVASLALAAAIGLAVKQEANATPTPESVLTPPIQAEACACLTGGTCTCGNCQCEPVVTPEMKLTDAMAALTKQLAESQAATDARLTDIEAATNARIDALITSIELQQDLAALVPDISRIPIEENPLQEVPTEADAQPTPYEVIFKAIDLLDLKNTETLVDFGCGPDARVLTHAFHDAGCRGVGIEIDSDRAASARNLVRTAGLSSWIEIVEGDATTESVEGSVGFAYLWPETLEELRPKLQELDRFVSYAHAVPGLTMQRIDVPGHEPLWYWERAPEVSYAERPYAVYNGRRYYSDYNPGCNCSMCRTIRTQLASRENVERIATQPQASTMQSDSSPRTATARTTTQRQSTPSYGCSNCPGGNCGRPMRFFRRR